MISFIVCIQSILRTVASNAIQNHEIIYVDSDSSDNSIEEVKQFENVKIIKLTGEVNAAIARNIGASEAKGEVLFFIDGDMEIKESFLSLIYSVEDGLYRDFVSGNWMK
jgi:glycosyltransferase involved in cell wall biosynthesis